MPPAEANSVLPNAVLHDAWGPDDDLEEATATGLSAPAPGATQQQGNQKSLLETAGVSLQEDPLLMALSGCYSQHGWERSRALRNLKNLLDSSRAHSKELEHTRCMQEVVQAVPSLRALCLSVIGRHLHDYIPDARSSLSWLPSEAKASLLAVARRRGQLTNEVLTALVDESWLSLDLAGACTLDGDALVQAAGVCGNQLRALDITGCSRIQAPALRAVARCCPLLRVLRVGGNAACNAAATAALSAILPRLVPALVEDITHFPASVGQSGASQRDIADILPIISTWEDLADKQQCWVRCPGRLSELEAIVWPDIPARAVALVLAVSPKVAINPVPSERELDTACALDAPEFQEVGPGSLSVCTSVPRYGGFSLSKTKVANKAQGNPDRRKHHRSWQRQHKRFMPASDLIDLYIDEV